MGFGLLLIGYFLINVTTLLAPIAVAMPVGFALVAMGAYRLMPYHSRFKLLFGLSLVGLPFGIYYTLYGLSFLGAIPSLAFLSGTAFAAVEWAYFVLSLLVQIALLTAISLLVMDLGLLEMQSVAMRNLVFVGIYHFVYLLAHLPVAGIKAHAGAFTLPITLLRFLCVFLNLWLLFRCYRNILPEGSDMVAVDVEEKGEEK